MAGANFAATVSSYAEDMRTGDLSTANFGKRVNHDLVRSAPGSANTLRTDRSSTEAVHPRARAGSSHHSDSSPHSGTGTLPLHFP